MQINGKVLTIYKQIPYAFTAFVLESLTGETISCVSKNMAAIQLGEDLVLEGEYVQHPKFGKQFSIDRVIETDPIGKEEIYKMLAKGKIPGIGPTLARKIVDKFGDDTLAILDNDISQLKSINGISTKRYNAICLEWTLQRKYLIIASFFEKYHLGSEKIKKLIDKYGQNTLNTVKSNPYVLMENIYDDISFLTCDKIAMDLGFSKTDNRRINAAIEYALIQNGTNGNIYTGLNQIESFLSKVLAIPLSDSSMNLVANNIAPMVKNNRLVYDADLDRLYLKVYYDAELSIANKLLSLQKPHWSKQITENDITHLESVHHITYSGIQKDFLAGMHQYGCQVLTGGPGTGKTTLLKAAIECLYTMDQNIVIQCLAPTGRAAKHLSTTTGLTARTLHMENTQRSMSTYKEPDVLIIDEMSMVELLVFNELITRTKAQMIIFVGDVNQLTAVGPGNILKDIINSKVIPVCVLKQIHRQQQGSAIIQNAFRINEGDKKLIINDKDFQFIPKRDDDIIDYAAEKYIQCAKEHGIMNVQLLIPMKKTTVSTTNINQKIQDKLNPYGKEINAGFNKIFREGDKVIETRNNYYKGVCNGDIGIIKTIDDANVVTIDFDGNLVEYASCELGTLLLAYAITVHKSQGGEYPVVIYAASLLHRKMLERNLLYTAVTRAKDKFILIGEKEAIDLAIKSNNNTIRNTMLKEFLMVNQ